ncbi:MAG: hypothetical protein MUD09_09885, partial [Desulfobacterales bacterium]|nr:hypothetical protein [Desulfobacterales bacterium]
DDRTDGSPFWHVGYHALFYTDFYLSDDEKSFRPFFVGNHFYIHCIITAGALCKSKEKWIDCNYEKRYF